MLLASMAVVLVLASGAAFAVLTFASGGFIERVVIARETSASTTTSTSFVAVPGASVGVFVPSGTTRLIMARYSAESACSGGTGYCSVRIVARNNSTGAITELQPAVGIDFAFDSTDAGRETGSSWESHSMDRSQRLGAGSYTISAQRAVTSSATTLRLDDWSLTVEQSR
jgi:hypothetical protein